MMAGLLLVLIVIFVLCQPRYWHRLFGPLGSLVYLITAITAVAMALRAGWGLL